MSLAQVAVAATVMRLVEGAFGGSQRGDFIDLVADERLGLFLWSAVESGHLPLNEESEVENDSETQGGSLTEAIFEATYRPRGLFEALRAGGKRWLNDVPLRRRLLEFLEPEEGDVDIDAPQFAIVRDAVRRALDLRDDQLRNQHWSAVRALSFRDVLNNEGLKLIARCTGLTSLDLAHAQVTDLSPLSTLTNLATLRLGGTHVTDLSPLRDLSALTALRLGGTPVSDISPLAGLSGLSSLDLGGTRVTDISALARLSRLTKLSLNHTPVTDLAPLARLSGLTWLNVSDTQPSDLSILASLSGLKTLEIRNTKVTDEEKQSLNQALPSLRILG